MRALADRLAGPMAADFNRALELMFGCRGRVVVTGMGKSGLIARKIAATLSSTGLSSALSASGRGAAWRPWNDRARRCSAGAFGQRRDGRDSAVDGHDQTAAGSADCHDLRRVRSKGSGRGRPLHASFFHTGFYSRIRCRRGFGLLDLSGGVFARTCSYRVHHNHAGSRRCSWRWRFRKNAVSRKKTLPTCIPAESWASGWREWNR